MRIQTHTLTDYLYICYSSLREIYICLKIMSLGKELFSIHRCFPGMGIQTARSLNVNIEKYKQNLKCLMEIYITKSMQ